MSDQRTFPVWIELKDSTTSLASVDRVSIEKALAAKVRTLFLSRFTLAKSQLVVRQPLDVEDFHRSVILASGARDASALADEVKQSEAYVRGGNVWIAIVPDKSGKIAALVERQQKSSSGGAPEIDVAVEDCGEASPREVSVVMQVYPTWDAFASEHPSPQGGDAHQPAGGQALDKTSAGAPCASSLLHTYLTAHRLSTTNVSVAPSATSGGAVRCPFHAGHVVDANTMRAHLETHHMDDCLTLVAEYALFPGPLDPSPITKVAAHTSPVKLDDERQQEESSRKRQREASHSNLSKPKNRRRSSRSSSSSSSLSSSSSSSSASSEATSISSFPAQRNRPQQGVTVPVADAAAPRIVRAVPPPLAPPPPPAPNFSEIHFSSAAGQIDSLQLQSAIESEMGRACVVSVRSIPQKLCAFVQLSSPEMAAQCIHRWWPNASPLVIPTTGQRLRCNWAKYSKQQQMPPPRVDHAPLQHSFETSTPSISAGATRFMPQQQQQQSTDLHPPPLYSDDAHTFNRQQPLNAFQQEEYHSHDRQPRVVAAADGEGQRDSSQQHRPSPSPQQASRNPSRLAVLHLTDADVSERVVFLDLSQYGQVLDLRLIPEWRRGTVLFQDGASVRALVDKSTLAGEGSGWLRFATDGFVI